MPYKIGIDYGLILENDASGHPIDAVINNGICAGKRLSECNSHYLAALYDSMELYGAPAQLRLLVKQWGKMGISSKRLIDGDSKSVTLQRWILERRAEQHESEFHRVPEWEEL